MMWVNCPLKVLWLATASALSLRYVSIDTTTDFHFLAFILYALVRCEDPNNPAKILTRQFFHVPGCCGSFLQTEQLP